MHVAALTMRSSLVLGITAAATGALISGCCTHGALDTSFGTGGVVTADGGSIEAGANAVAIPGDGKIVAGGYNVSAGGDPDFAVARLALGGELDSTFGGSGFVVTALSPHTDIVKSIAIQGDGKIVAAGYTGPDVNADFALARYTEDGVLDLDFGSGGVVTTSLGPSADVATSVALQADGRLVVAGHSSIGVGSEFALARYMPNGTLDASFNGSGIVKTALGGSGTFYAVAVQSNGKIVAAGSYRGASGSSDTVVARFSPDGVPDPTFDGDGFAFTAVSPQNDQAESLAIQSDGRIVVGGTSDGVGGDDFTMVRYTPDGNLDPSFGIGGIVQTQTPALDDSIFSVAVRPDGKLLTAGHRDGADGFEQIALARYQANGSLDSSFGDNGFSISHFDIESLPYSIALQQDGKFVIAGQLTLPDQTADFVILRYLDGSCCK